MTPAERLKKQFQPEPLGSFRLDAAPVLMWGLVGFGVLVMLAKGYDRVNGQADQRDEVSRHWRPEAVFTVLADKCDAPAVQHRIAQIKADGFKVICSEPPASTRSSDEKRSPMLTNGGSFGGTAGPVGPLAPR